MCKGLISSERAEEEQLVPALSDPNTETGLHVNYLMTVVKYQGAPFCWGTALQTGTSRVRFPMVSATNRNVAGSIPDGVIGIFR